MIQAINALKISAPAIFGGGKIINVMAAANGGSWDGIEKQSLYKSRASQPSMPVFYESSRLEEMQQDNGGIFFPKEGSLMTGNRIFRLVETVSGVSDKELFGRATSEWFGSPSVFAAAKEAAKSMTLSDCRVFDQKSKDDVFLQLLKYYQGLGGKYNIKDSRIVEYKVTKPLIALTGRGKSTMENYGNKIDDSSKPLDIGIGTYQPSPQIFVPGYKDPKGVKDIELMKESIEIIDVKDAIAYLQNT